MVHRRRIRRLEDINGILLFLLVCGIILGVLSNKEINNQAIESPSLLESDFFSYVYPLIYSRSIKKLALAIHKFSDHKDVDSILKRIMEQVEWPLTLNDKILLTISLASLYKDDLSKQLQVLNVLIPYAKLFSDADPLLYILARSKSDVTSISMVLKWLASMEHVENPFIEKAIQNAFFYAIRQNDSASFNYMLAHGVPLSKLIASQLLWYVVENNKDPLFISKLVQFKADVDKARHSYTPLMQAILNKNKAMVISLLKAGSNPNLVIDDAVGTALQIVNSEAFQAYQTNQKDNSILYNDLENILRSFGAR